MKKFIDKNKNLGFYFQINGHTDSKPIKSSKYQTNLELSWARAESVKSFFITQGVPEEKLSIMGYGDKIPLSNGQTSEDFKRNRRIELEIRLR